MLLEMKRCKESGLLVWPFYTRDRLLEMLSSFDRSAVVFLKDL